MCARSSNAYFRVFLFLVDYPKSQLNEADFQASSVVGKFGSAQPWSDEMRVLLCIYRDSEQAGGSVRVAEVLVRSLLRRGVDVQVAVAYGGGGRISQILGDSCHLLQSASRKDPRGWWRFRRLLGKLSPDVVHYVDGVGWMIASAAGFRDRRIIHQHYRPNVGPNGHRRLWRIRWLARTADKVVAVSHGAARQLTELCQIHPSRIAVVHNAIDNEYLNVGPKMRGSVRRLGMAVRVVEDKGIEDALTLLARLPGRFLLTVAGEGPALSRLKSTAEEKGVSHRVEWLGSVRDIAQFYARIDYYLFMSWYEGFGLSVAEAMACGRPVVGLLGDGEIAESEYPLVTPHNSLLLPRSSPGKFACEMDSGKMDELRDAVLRLDTDEEAQGLLIANGRRWIDERFSPDIFGGRMHREYLELLQEDI